MGQMGDYLKAIPAGIGTLATTGARTAWDSTIGRNVDMAFGNEADRRKALTSAIAAPSAVDLFGRTTAANALGHGEMADELYGDYAPLAKDYGSSLNTSGMRLRHPSRYIDAIEEGRIVGAVLEDLGNIALVGGPASKVVGAAGRGATAAGMTRTGSALTKAGSVGEQVAALGNAVGDAPFSIPRRGINLAGRGVLDQALPALARNSPAVAKMVDNAPQFLTREGRDMRALARDGSRTADRSSARIGREMKRVTERNNISPVEQEAAAALIRGQADLFRNLSEQTGLSVAEIADVAQPDKLPESYTSPEAAELAVQIANGTADPAIVERLTPYLDELRTQRDRQTNRALEGDGRDTSLMEEQVTSDAPLSVAVARAADEGMPVNLDDPMTYAARYRPLMAQARAVDQYLGRSEDAARPVGPLAVGERSVRAVTGDPYVGIPADHVRLFRGEDPTKPLMDQQTSLGVPGRNWTTDYTEAQGFTGTGGQVYSVDVPVAEIMQRQGFDPPPGNAWTTRRPNDVLAAIDDQRTGTSSRLGAEVWSPDVARASASPPRPGLPLRPEQMTAAGINAEYLPGGKARAALNSGSRLKSNLANEGQTIFGDTKLSDEYMRGADAIGPTSAAGITDKLMQAEKQAIQNQTYRDLLGKHGRDYKAVLDDVLPDIEARAKQAADMAHADPRRQAGRYVEERGQAVIEAMAERGFEPWPVKGRVDAPIKAADIDQAAWLPAGMKKTLTPFWNPKPPGIVLRALEKTNAKFKGAVLPFSLRWQMGDAISNMMMAATVAGVDPLTLFKRMREASKLKDTPEGARVLDESYVESGLFFDEQEFLRGPFKTKAERRDLPVLGQRRPLKAFQQGSYRFNEWSNRLQRQGTFLEKLDRDMRKKGIALDSLGEAGNLIDDPQIKASIEKALKDVSFALGDMSNLSPFERRVMKQVMPFYPWMRHVSKLASGLAIDHPARLVFMMRIGSLAANGDMDDLPPFLQGSVQGPGGYWQTSWMNPLADVEALPALSPQGALRSLAPGIKLTASALTGGDLNRGGLQLTRPADTGNRDWYGRDAINPLLFDPGALAYQASRTIPLTREAWNQAFGPDARFGTGETITNKYGQSIDPGNRWESLPKLAGIPLPFAEADVEKIQAQRAERLRAQAKANR